MEGGIAMDWRSGESIKGRGLHKNNERNKVSIRKGSAIGVKLFKTAHVQCTAKDKRLFIDLDIKRKDFRIPASGPKMKVVQTYVHEKVNWTAASN